MSTTPLDGSVLEGGGQLVRNAVAFSALLARPVTVHNVRAGRPVAGLKAQHVAGLKLAAEICGARLDGAEKGSMEISFHPSRIAAAGGDYVADPGTAGSTTLLLQTALPSLLFAPSPAAREDSEEQPSPSSSPSSSSSLTLRGGTNATSAPQIDYTAHVLLPFLARRLGLGALSLSVPRRGYHPRGGGEVALRIPPVPPGRPLPAVVLTHRGAVVSVRGRAFVAGSLPAHLAHRIADAAKARLVAAGAVDARLVDIRAVRERPEDAVGNGSGIVLWAETEGGCVIGGSAVGAKGTDAGDTGRSAAEELARNLAHDGCVDEYLQDQMIIFLALAKGRSIVATGPLTLHTRTAIWLAEQLTNAKFSTEDEEGTGRTLIICEGIGLTSSVE